MERRHLDLKETGFICISHLAIEDVAAFDPSPAVMLLLATHFYLLLTNSVVTPLLLFTYVLLLLTTYCLLDVATHYIHASLLLIFNAY